MAILKVMVDICYIVLLLTIGIGLALNIYQSHWERGISRPVIKQMAYDLIHSRQENEKLRVKIAEVEAELRKYKPLRKSDLNNPDKH